MRKLVSNMNNCSVIAAALLFCGILFGNNFKTMAYDNAELMLSEKGKVSAVLFSGGTPPMAPGSSISQSFDIKNNTGRNYDIVGFKLTSFKIAGDDFNKIQDASLINYFTDCVSIKLEEKRLLRNAIIFDETMTDLLKNDGLKLAGNKISIWKGKSKNFLITLSMNRLTDNRLQGIKASFGTDFSAVSPDGFSASTVGGISGEAIAGETNNENTAVEISGGSAEPDENTEAGEANMNPIADCNTVEGSNLSNLSAPTITTADNGKTQIILTGWNNISQNISHGNDMKSANAKRLQGGNKNVDSTDIPARTSKNNTSENSDEESVPSKLGKVNSFLYTEILIAVSIILLCVSLMIALKKNKT